MNKKSDKIKEFNPAGLITLFVIIIAAEVMILIWCRTQCIETGYKIHEKAVYNQSLTDRKKKLEVEIARLKSPARMERLAKKFGLDYPKPEQIKVIP